MKVVQLSLFSPPVTYGPRIDVVVDHITAVESVWESSVEEAQAKVHLVGGEQLRVCQTVEQVWAAIRSLD